MAGLCAVALGGASCAPPVCSEDPPGAYYQLAPDRRAAAYVDPETFSTAFTWLQRASDRELSFSCLIDRFTNAFDNDLDVLVLVLNLSDREFLERSSTDIISNFTSVQRAPEVGVGRIPRPLAPAGPPRMRSYSVLGARQGLLAGPLLHELAHSWCAYVDGPAALNAQVRRQPPSHWGFTSVGGVLGGWDPQSWTELGEDTYRVCGPTAVEPFAPAGYATNSVPFAPLELYLMGLLDAEAVPDIRVAVDPQIVGPVGTCVSFTATAIATVTIDDLVAANGRRSPGPDTAQRHFEIGLVILAEAALTTEEWAYYGAVIDCLQDTSPCGMEVTPLGAGAAGLSYTPLNFFEATGGRATLAFVTLDPASPPLDPASLPLGGLPD